MKKPKRKAKPTSEEHRTEALQKEQIKTLRRVAAQRREISSLLRKIHRLGESADIALFEFALKVLAKRRADRAEAAEPEPVTT
jgi:hypothetical protein